MKKSHTIIILVCLIIISIPRFNWDEFCNVNALIGREKSKKTIDVNQYIAYTEYFRGNSNLQSKLLEPFTYRPFVPFLASFLPFRAITSINIVNLIALLLTIFALQQLLKEFNFSGRYIFYGEILFVFSFPVFYYSTLGYVDSVLILFLTSALYLLIKGKFISFILVFILGLTVKETMLILIPVAGVYLYLQEKLSLSRKIILFSIITIVYFLESFIIRIYVPGEGAYLWMPQSDKFLYNLKRAAGYITTILAFGVPGIGAILFLTSSECRKHFGRIKYVLLTGMVFSILVSIFAILAAYAEGRYIWITYPFTIPLAVAYLKYFMERKKSSPTTAPIDLHQ